MKKIILLIVLLMLVGSISVGTYFFSDHLAGVQEEFEGGDPDMPSQFQTGMTQEEYLLARAEAVGFKRGIEKDKPFDPTLRPKAIAKMDKQEKSRLQGDAPKAVTAAWTPIGPAPIPNGQTVGVSTAVSGRVTSVAVHPTNPSIAFVGTAQGGLYRTTDDGHDVDIVDGCGGFARHRSGDD